MSTGLTSDEYVDLRLEPPASAGRRSHRDQSGEQTGVVYVLADLENALRFASTRGPIGDRTGSVEQEEFKWKKGKVRGLWPQR